MGSTSPTGCHAPPPDAMPEGLPVGEVRFVAWKYVKRPKDKKRRKVPIRPDGACARTNDPSTWSGLEACRGAVLSGRAAGVGVVLGELADGRYLGGLDLDVCRDPRTGEIMPWAQERIHEWGTYAEVSPSGTGVKMFGLAAELPAIVANEATVDAPVPAGAAGGDHDRPEIGLYAEGRYFTITGRHLEGTPRRLADVTPALAETAAELARMAGRKTRNPSRQRAAGPERDAAGALPGALARALREDPELRRAWREGAKLGRGGDGSASGRDFSLALHLRRRHRLADGDIRAALRRFPHGQIGSGKLAGRDAERQLARILEKIGPALPYDIVAGGIVWLKPTRDGATPVPLTNFTARIVAEVERDDGAERTLTFGISATIDGRRHEFQVPSGDFAGLNWVTRELGARAMVYPGQALKDHARFAIQALSPEPARRTVHAHTGWREVDGRAVYLHAGGGIGADGPVAGVETDLAACGLELYELPDPPRGERLAEAVRASLRVLGLAPLAVVAAPYAMVWRSVLGPADFGGHLVGPTGVFKTELAALAQQHFGAGMDARHLPGSWSSTGNSLEAQGFAAKDALLTVDDFAPGGSQQEVRRSHAEAGRLVRAQGNNSGRQRMRPDGTLRPAKPPRGLLLSTGEEVPAGHSIRARLSIVEVGKGQIDAGRLAACQRDAAAGLYAEALAGYLRWLAADLDARRGRFRARRDALRAERIGAEAHARTPWIAAELVAALELFLAFAAEAGAIEAAEAGRLAASAAEALGTVAGEQAGHLRAEDPARRFVALVAALLGSKEAHLARYGQPERPPEDAQADAMGWQRRATVVAGAEHVEWTPQGRRIGWLKDEGDKAEGDRAEDGRGLIILEGEAAYAAAQKLGTAQGQALPVQPRTLWKRLAEAGLLAARDKDRVTYTAYPGGRRAKGTLALPASLICGQKRDERDERDTERAEPSDGAGRIPVPHPVSSRASAKNGMEERDAGAGRPGVPGAGGGAPPGNPVHPAPAGAREPGTRTQAGAAAERAVRSPDALADEAEVMLRGELVP